MVFRTTADEWGQALDRFQVVVKHVWHAVETELKSEVAVVKVWSQHLDDDTGIGFADGFDDEFEVLGSTVTEVVTADGGDDDMF